MLDNVHQKVRTEFFFLNIRLTLLFFQAIQRASNEAEQAARQRAAQQAAGRLHPTYGGLIGRGRQLATIPPQKRPASPEVVFIKSVYRAK